MSVAVVVPVSHQRLDAQRSRALRALEALDAEAALHGGPAGLRARLCPHHHGLPIGSNGLRYAQCDVWRAEGVRRLDHAATADGVASAVSDYRTAMHLFDGAHRLLHGIRATHGAL